MNVAVKICGLVRPADAVMADRLGADYLGVILSDGFGRSVPVDEAHHLLEGTDATRVAVLVDESVDEAVRRATALGAGVVQLHGNEHPSVLEALRDRGEWRLWKAVRARELGDVERAVERYGAVADALLVEGWKEGVVGGGGATLRLDPAAVRGAVGPALDFVLAGGLAPDSVDAAVAHFTPDVVDVSSGVESTRGEKSPELVRRFLQAAKSGRAAP